MQVGFAGIGRTGQMIALSYFRQAEMIQKRWGIRILAGNPQDPLSAGVAGLNTDDADTLGVRGLPNKILIPSGDRLEGTGSGRVASFTSELMRRPETRDKILSDLREKTKLTLNAQAIIIAASADGGTGGGGIWELASILKQLSSTPLPIYVILTLPFTSLEKNDLRMENSMECLKVLVEGMATKTLPADAIFLIHNQRFINENQSLDENYDRIDNYCANFFGPLFAASQEESAEKLGTDILDVREVMGAMSGVCAIAMGSAEASRSGGFWSKGVDKYWMEQTNQRKLTRACIEDAFDNLSISCFDSESGVHKAGGGLCLITSAPKIVTPTVVETVGDIFKEKCSGNRVQTGVHPVGKSNDLVARIIVSDIAGSEVVGTLLRLITLGTEAKARREANDKSLGNIWEKAQEQVAGLQVIEETPTDFEGEE